MAEIGRLIRESNPVPNTTPGFTPQHQLSDGSYAITGIANNLPVTDAITQARLNTTIAELQNLKAQLAGIIDGSAPANTQLTGSNVPEKINASGLETRIATIGGTIGGQVTKTVIDLPDMEVELSSLTMGTNYQNAELIIRPYLADGTRGEKYTIADKMGDGRKALRPSTLDGESGGENDFFKNQFYEESTSSYVITMKRSAKFGNGLTIEVYNFSSAEQKIAVSSMIYIKNR